jgi:hypothetical protein
MGAEFRTGFDDQNRSDAMGIFEQSSNVRPFPATILMADFQARGSLHVVGQLQTFLNDEQKTVFTVQDVGLYGLAQGSPAVSMQIPQMWLNKSACHVVAFEQEFPPSESGLMIRSERLVLYTSHFAIQGDFHMGADTPVPEFVDATKALFVGATDASIFPLFQPQSRVIGQAPLVYVHRGAVRMHHAI